MERSGASAPAFAPPELVELAAREGPFLSLYMTTEVAADHAAARALDRWKSLRRSLGAQGAPERCLEVVDDLVPDAHNEGSTLGVVTDGSGVLVVDHDVDPPARELACFGSAPVLTPLVAWRQHEPPYVVALVDRAGADLLALRRDMPPVAETAGAGVWPLSKSRGGGRAHYRYQHHVEENWARNERRVAQEIERLCDDVGAQVVVLAGDAQALGILGPTLAERVQPLVRMVPGSRQAESAHDGLGDATARWVHTAAGADTVTALETWRSAVAQTRGVEGADATCAALREAQVDVLFAHDPRLTRLPEPADATMPRAWFDTGSPNVCALAKDALDGVGTGSVAEALLVDVAVRGALVSGAAVRLVPDHGGVADGVGALLRWAA